MEKSVSKTKQAEPSINDLKAAVYDRMSEIERLSLIIQQYQKEIQGINQEIQEKLKK